MPTVIKTLKATEESTYIVIFTFKDEDGAAMTPNTCLESLTDLDGTIINSIDARVNTPASVLSIVYSGDDLTLSEGVGRKRISTVLGTYTSSYGVNLPYVETAEFEIVNPKGNVVT